MQFRFCTESNLGYQVGIALLINMFLQSHVSEIILFVKELHLRLHCLVGLLRWKMCRYYGVIDVQLTPIMSHTLKYLHFIKDKNT